jgi:hypothetical protein
MPDRRRESVLMFRADAEAAGIAYREVAGRVADFRALPAHSLRT